MLVCHPVCSTCFLGLENTCQSCSDPSKVLFLTTCNDTCPLHYYSENRICLGNSLYYFLKLECNPTCSACINGASTGCLNCTGGLLLFEGQCFDECPEGTFQVNTTCIKCTPPCLVCPNSQDCEQCDDPTYLLVPKASCVAKEWCPDGTYADDSIRQCVTCDPSCKTCMGPTAYDCLTCKTIIGYADKTTTGPGPCQKIICTDGQYLFINLTTTKSFCLQCQPRCQTCNSNFPIFCTKCKAEFLEFPTDNGLLECKTCSDFLGQKKGPGLTCEGINICFNSLKKKYAEMVDT